MAYQMFIVPSEEEVKKLEEEPERFEHLLSLFQNWLHYQTHLPQNFNRTVLGHFLRSCKMDFEKAKRKFESFCYLPITYEKLYGNRVATLEHDIISLDYMYSCLLPKMTEEGYRILITKAADVDKCDVLSLFRTATAVADYRVHHETYVVGDIMILDLEKIGPQFYGKMFSPLLLHVIRIAVEAYPSRVKKVFVVSCHPLLEKGISLIKSVLPEKMKERFYFLNNANDLIKYIPKEVLPSDYNGDQPSMATLSERWKHYLLENIDFFKDVEKMKPIGPIPEHIHVFDENLGVDGSFRKLNID